MRYLEPFERIQRTVLPVRMRSNRESHRVKWWIFAESRPALTAALARTPEVLVLSAVSSHAIPVRISTGPLMSSAVVVFPEASSALLATLSSSAHLSWVLRWGSLLDLRIRYSTTDVFETFPFPSASQLLDESGTRLDLETKEIMNQRRVGLTALYNLVNNPDVRDDPDIERIREIHVEVDEAVMSAYGWNAIPLDHGFHTYRQLERWTVSPTARIEILDRLLQLNHERARAEGQNVPEQLGTF